MRECRKIEGHSLLLLVYNLVREDVPLSLVRVLCLFGKAVFEQELYEVGEIELLEDGRNIRVHISQPEFPG